MERRFDRRVRTLASTVYIVAHIIFTPVLIYVPALAFSQGMCKFYFIHLKKKNENENDFSRFCESFHNQLQSQVNHPG